MTKKLISWDDVALALPAVVMTKLLATFDALGAAAAVTPASIGAATPASVTAAVAALVNAAPGTMDTLGEIATVIASDESAAAALLTSVATKATIASLTAETSRATAAEGANAAAIAKAVPRWAATTAYTAGDQVVSPNNDVVKRTTTGTSGATYDPTQWQVSATYLPVLTPVETIAYNADGTVASQTIGGVATTYTYNTDLTVATESRSGVTRTYGYTAGVLTAVA